MHLFQLIRKPAYQALLFVIFSIAVTFIIRPRIADNVWVICGLTYCFFILANSVLSFFAVNVWQYFFISLGVSFLYLLVAGFIANMLINALKLEGSGESGMIFLVIIFHPVSLLVSIALKWAFLKMA